MPLRDLDFGEGPRLETRDGVVVLVAGERREAPGPEVLARLRSADAGFVVVAPGPPSEAERVVLAADDLRPLVWLDAGEDGAPLRWCDGVPVVVVAGDSGATELDPTAGEVRGPGLRAALPPADARRWHTRRVRGWDVHLERALEADEELRDAVLALLDTKLWEVETALPATAVARLREVPLWFLRDHADAPGGVYHPSLDWLREHEGFDPRWAGGVEFGVAANFLGWTRVQPSMVLHELAHAWHHQVLGWDDPTWVRLHGEAVASGRWDDVLHVEGGRSRHYALSNPQEFFAELTEARFGVNDFHPFVRGELAEFAPDAYAALDAAWAAEPVRPR